MRKLVGVMAAAVVFAAAGPGYAEEIQAAPVTASDSAASTDGASGELRRDEGWNSPWALLFSLNGFFATQDSILTQALSNFGIGGTYHLDHTMAVRPSVSFSRTSQPEQVTKTVVENGTDSVTTYAFTFPGSTSDVEAVRARVDALMRLSENIVAPYVGGGAFYRFDRSALQGTNDVAVVDQITTTNNVTKTHGFGVRGILGAEWRLHSNFAIFAEYNVDVTLIQQVSVRNVTATESTAGGTRTVSRTTETRSTPRWMNFSTGLAQGASLGLAAHF